MSPTVLETALDDALSRRLVTVDYLARRLESAGHKSRRGTRELSRLRKARTDGRPRAQSRVERRLVEVLTAAGLPPRRRQFEVARGTQLRTIFRAS